MNYRCVLNAQAGTAASGAADAPTPDALQGAFAGFGTTAAIDARPPQEIDAALRAAIAVRPDAVIVGGGDGTVRAAAALLVDTGIPLGVLPLGTLNHFAKDLKIPTDWREAVRTLAAARVHDVDVGEVNGRVFINNCSIGSYAEAIRHRDRLRRERGWQKWPAMLSATLATFRRLRLLDLRVASSAGERRLRTPLAVVANNRYSGHVLEKSLRARLDEGRLWFYAARAHRHAAVLRLVLQALIHRIDAADGLLAEPVTEATVDSASTPLSVAADGELVETNWPLHFRIRPRALRVLAPLPQ
jgi:diacylglycerol kinase family enzyme